MRYRSTAIYFSAAERNVLARILFLSVTLFLFPGFVSNVIPCVASGIQSALLRARKSWSESRTMLSAATRENKAASYRFAEELALYVVSPGRRVTLSWRLTRVSRIEDRTFPVLVSTLLRLVCALFRFQAHPLHSGTVPNNRLVILPNQPIVEAKTIVSFYGRTGEAEDSKASP